VIVETNLLRRGGALAATLAVAAAFVLFPLIFSNPTTTSIAFFVLIYMIAATAWNVFSGFSGYIALGHAVFFGAGAYTLAVGAEKLHAAAGWTPFALVPLAGLVAGAIAVPFGLIALRTRRHTFVVITIAIFFIFQTLAFNLSFTGGSSGLQTPFPLWTAVGYNQRFYYVALAILVATVAMAVVVRRSRLGLQLLAIRDDEDRALGLGVRTGRVKLFAFTLSAIPIGMAGAVYAYFLGQIFPQFAFDPLFDITIALMAFFGGLATVVGPLLGALVLESMQQEFTLRFSAGGGIYLIAYGALFLAVILVMPRGIVPTLSDAVTTRQARRTGRVGVGVQAPVRSRS
jgi:branched-chain amino acid transport system permease protein